MPDLPERHVLLIVVTTASDSDDKFRLDQPLRVIFDKALREVRRTKSRPVLARVPRCRLSALSRMNTAPPPPRRPEPR